jgi:hypothetical protein
MISRYHRAPILQRSYHCHSCVQRFERQEVRISNEGKMGGLTAGLLAGAASKNPIVGIGVAVVGFLIGHWIDEEITPKCPVCGEVLQVLVQAALRS